MTGKIVDVFTAIVWGLTASMIGAFGVYSTATALNKTSMYISPEFIRMGTILGGLLWGISAAIIFPLPPGDFPFPTRKCR